MLPQELLRFRQRRKLERVKGSLAGDQRSENPERLSIGGGTQLTCTNTQTIVPTNRSLRTQPAPSNSGPQHGTRRYLQRCPRSSPLQNIGGKSVLPACRDLLPRGAIPCALWGPERAVTVMEVCFDQLKGHEFEMVPLPKG